MRPILLLVCAASFALAQKKPFDVETMLKLSRISEPALSPDGKLVAFTVQTVDLEKNTRPKQIYVVPLEGGIPRQITHDGTNNERPRWSPDSKQLYYVSNRGGSAQIWAMDPDGGRTRQITRLSTEAGGILVSPDGTKIVFQSNVYPDCGADDACNQKKLDADAKNPVKARVYTSLLYRHWTEWQSNRRQHLMVVNTDGSELKDLTPFSYDVPPFSLGGPMGYAISPDSTELAYVANADAVPA